MTIEVREKVEPEVRVKTVPEVLRHAALVIEEQGLCKGNYRNWNGPGVCAVGAINAALTGDPSDDRGWNDFTMKVDDAYSVLIRYLGQGGITTWNDQPERTAAEVTAALRAAADAYETGPVRP